MLSSTIVTEPADLEEGLFGQVFLYAFEILPYLRENSVPVRSVVLPTTVTLCVPALSPLGE